MDAELDLIRKVKLNNQLLPIVVVGLAALQIFRPHRAWEILLIAFGGALLLSASWAFALEKGLSFSREMRHGWAQVGDKFSEQFTISNKSRFSAFSVSLHDRSNFPGYQSSVAWPVRKQFDKLWYLDSVCYTRGLYRVGPAEIHTSDPFGIFEVTIQSSLEKEILVTPPVVPLLQIEIASGEWQSDGGVKTRVYERSVIASSVREYQSGDNLYSVHWLTSARRDDLFVRTFDQNPSSDWWIFLDLDRSVQAGEGLDTTEEYGAVLAASIADRGLKENRAVGLVGEGSKPLWLPPKTGMGQRAEIMYSLALVDLGDQPLKTLLARSQRSLGRKSSVIVVTPSVDPQWLDALTTLRQRGVATTVLSLDPLDFGSDESSAPILAQLDALGIRNYSINKSIYQRPEIKDYFPNKGSALSIYGNLKGEEE